MQNPDYIRALYAITPVLFWPVVWLRVFMLRKTIERLTAEGYGAIGYVWDPQHMRFRITLLEKTDAPDPLAVCAPSMDFLYAITGYMPETLWALTFNIIPLFRDTTRLAAPFRMAATPPLEPG